MAYVPPLPGRLIDRECVRLVDLTRIVDEQARLLHRVPRHVLQMLLADSDVAKPGLAFIFFIYLGDCSVMARIRSNNKIPDFLHSERQSKGVAIGRVLNFQIQISKDSPTS